MHWSYVLLYGYWLTIDDYLWELLLLNVIFSMNKVYMYVWGVSFICMLFLAWLFLV